MTALLRSAPSWSGTIAIGLAVGCSGQTFSSSSSGSGGSSAGGSDAGGATGGNSGSGGASAGGSNDASAGTGGTTGAGGATGGTVSTGGTASGGTSTGGTVASGGVSGAGGAATGGMGTVGSDAATYVCSGPSSFSVTVDKGCSSVQNCGLVSHTRDCCGTELVMAINHAAVMSFDAAEAYCDAQLPKCGCASQGVFAEDGTMVPFGAEKLIAASCTNGTCQSHYDGNVFKCGDKLCTDLQYCKTDTPILGTATYSCVALPNGCNACGCISTTLGCSCSQTQGHLTVACVG